MAQKILDKKIPLVKVGDSETIPAAIIDAQTRNDEDEVILGTVPMVRNASNTLWVPVDKDNPLEARVRALEDLIGALDASKETNPDAASATLLALLRGLLSAASKETTLGAVKTAVESLAQEEFATETTLGAVKTAVESIAEEDFATQTTLAALKTEIDKLTALISDSRLKTEATLKGSDTDTVTFFDAVEIRSTDSQISSTVDLSKYRRVIFVARNTLDQAVSVRMQFEGAHIFWWDGQQFKNFGSSANYIQVPAGATWAILNDVRPEILDKAFPGVVRWIVSASVTPTTGSFTIEGWVVP